MAVTIGGLLSLLLAEPALAACTADGSSGELSGECVEDLVTLSNGLAYFALILCLAGVLISVSLWAIGSKGQNPGQELTGKKGMILCLTAAFFIGALPSLMDFLDEEADKVQRDANSKTLAKSKASNGILPVTNAPAPAAPVRAPGAIPDVTQAPLTPTPPSPVATAKNDGIASLNS